MSDPPTQHDPKTECHHAHRRGRGRCGGEGGPGGPGGGPHTAESDQAAREARDAAGRARWVAEVARAHGRTVPAAERMPAPVAPCAHAGDARADGGAAHPRTLAGERRLTRTDAETARVMREHTLRDRPRTTSTLHSEATDGEPGVVASAG